MFVRIVDPNTHEQLAEPSEIARSDFTNDQIVYYTPAQPAGT